MKRVLSFCRTHVCAFFWVALGILATAFGLLIAASLRTETAEWLNRGLCSFVRRLLGRISTVLPFSLGELLLLLIPLAFTFLMLLGICRIQSGAGRTRLISAVLGCAMLIGAMHILTLGIAYRAYPLEDKLGYEKRSISADDLYRTAKTLKESYESLLDQIEYDENGSARMPYSMDALSEKLCRGFDAVEEEFGILQNFDTRIKPIALSVGMSYLQLLGIYTFYTGEANINTDYPAYNFPFTAAHELAHQRGIIRENEANFVGFLVCIHTDDPFVQYSGYLNMYEYVAAALYKASPALYGSLTATLDDRVKDEMSAYQDHYAQYADTVVGAISEQANDAYLKWNGTEGSVSYGLVVDLAVAYYRE